MATTTGRQTARKATSPAVVPVAGQSNEGPGWTPPRAAIPSSRRRPALVALGVALAAVGALMAVYLVNTASHRTAVIMVERAVPAGATITSSDLAIAHVSVDPAVRTVPATQREAITGKVATVGLSAGALLAPGQFGDAGPVVAGRTLVPLSLPHSRMPVTGLAPGQAVLVVDTPPQDADPPTSPPSTIPALVVRVGSPDLNGVTVVDVTVVAGDGPALAARAATGRIAVVVEAKASS